MSLFFVPFTGSGQSDSPLIIVDQYGYLPDAPKIAVIKDPQAGFDADNSVTPGSNYAVVNSATGDTVFTGWSLDASGTNNPLTIVMNVDKEIIANFAPTYKLTVNSGNGSGEYPINTEIVIEADTPPEGQIFDVWTGDVETVADVDSSITNIIMPAGDISVTATFMDDTLSVGLIYPAGSGNVITLYPNPAAGDVRLIAPGFDGEAAVSLLDINGVIVMQEILGSGGELLINTSSLPGGTYIVRVSSGTRTAYARLVLL